MPKEFKTPWKAQDYHRVCRGCLITLCNCIPILVHIYEIPWVTMFLLWPRHYFLVVTRVMLFYFLFLTSILPFGASSRLSVLVVLVPEISAWLTVSILWFHCVSILTRTLLLHINLICSTSPNSASFLYKGMQCGFFLSF